MNDPVRLYSIEHWTEQPGVLVRGWRRLRWIPAGAAVAAVLPSPVAAAYEPFPVEATYAVRGPHEVATDTIADADGRTYELLFPADLSVGAPHPIVTWGNGSAAVPSQYAGLLHQLASWGMVVIASTTTEAGTGDEMLAGARHLVATAADPASSFHGVLDTEHIAAAGHSQGAGGAVRAATASAGLITTTVTVALPNRIWVTPFTRKEFEPRLLTGPALFLAGGQDQVISGSSTNREFFDEVPGAAAVAVLTAADHNTIQGTGGALLGYLTAWMRYQLFGDVVAAGAFAGDDPEIARNPAWQDQATKGLVAPPPPTGSPSPAAPAAPVAVAPPPVTSPAPRPRLPASGRSTPTLLAAGVLALGLTVRRAARQ